MFALHLAASLVPGNGHRCRRRTEDEDMNHYATELLARQRTDQFAREAERDIQARLSRAGRAGRPSARLLLLGRIPGLAERLVRRGWPGWHPGRAETGTGLL